MRNGIFEFRDDLRKVHRDRTVLRVLRKRTILAGIKAQLGPFRFRKTFILDKFQRCRVQRDIENFRVSVFEFKRVSELNGLRSFF